jgi:Fe-S-cluster containining protein
VAALLDISVEELTLRYLEPQADLWAIKTSEKGYCLMWDGLGCRIHKAKPLMCAAWPYFYGPLTQEEAFKAAQDACPGLKGWVWARLKETCLKWPPKSFYKFLSQKPFKGDQEG